MQRSGLAVQRSGFTVQHANHMQQAMLQLPRNMQQPCNRLKCFRPPRLFADNEHGKVEGFGDRLQAVSTAEYL
jgi:hypothetical protein